MLKALYVGVTLLAGMVFGPQIATAGELFVVTRANQISPHVGCVVRFDDGSYQWLHFRPIDFKKSVALFHVPGQLDEVGYDQNVNHLVGFRVPDEKLRHAERLVRKQFAAGTKYHLLDHDCVTFAIMVCRACGIKTKDDHFHPSTLFSYVRENNQYFEAATNVDRFTPGAYTLPWQRAK